MVVIADDSKHVPMLGRFPLSIEVNHFGFGATERAIAAVMQAFGAQGGLRRRLLADGTPYVTDGGHAIVDASFGRIPQPETLAEALNRVPGVVEHGLFIGLCQRVYVAGPAGVTVLDA
jgi:ribose 5-phosphate isomerase A